VILSADGDKAYVLHVQRQEEPGAAHANAALDRLAGLAIRVLGVPVALVSLVEEDRQVFPGCVGLPEPWGVRRETPLSHSFCQHVVASGEALVIDDARMHPLVAHNLAIPDLGVVAYAGVPLATPSGHVVGSFCAIDTQPRAWNQWELDVLADLAAAAATEIELREQIRQAELARTTLATVNGVGQLLNAELDLDRLVQAITDAATDLTGAGFGALLYNEVDEHGEVLSLYTLTASPREAFANFPHPPATAIFGPTLRGEAIIRLDDIRQDSRFGPSVLHHGLPFGRLPVVSYLAVPVLARSGEVLGGLFFGHPEPGVFDTRAEELAVGLASHAAVAIENARLFEHAQMAEARYRGVFGGVADVILVADAHARYLDANPAAEVLLGYSRDELIGMGVADVVAGESGWTEAEYARFMADGSWRGELELRRKDGVMVPVEAWATVVDLPTGQIYLSAIRDISERRALERAQQEFIASASHDLKNPLTAMKGQAQLLGRRARRAGSSSDGALVKGLEQVVALSDRMTAQIDELSDIARLRLGQPLQLRPEPTNLVTLVEEAVSGHMCSSSKHTILLKADVPSVIGSYDRLRLIRVLDNILSNAIKYSPAGGTIVASIREETTTERAWAAIEVRDDGVGILATDLPHVFERFRRGVNVADHISGTGIGLAGARQIVEQHGGTIAIDSHEGVGTTVTVRLPIDLDTPIVAG
jgi:PAS domain S-box-containing protein